MCCYPSFTTKGVVHKVLTVLQGSHVPDLPTVNRKSACELHQHATTSLTAITPLPNATRTFKTDSSDR